jgi:RNA polymerase sigma-70 factor, ECF subfamily
LDQSQTGLVEAAERCISSPNSSVIHVASSGRSAPKPSAEMNRLAITRLRPTLSPHGRFIGMASDVGSQTGQELLPARETKLVALARDGNEQAYRDLVEPYRARLHAHCYRMLGSLQDSEDALQETLLRVWRGLAGFDETRSFRPWLYRIATNACINLLAKRPSRVLPPDARPSAAPTAGPGDPLAHAPWLEPFPNDVIGIDEGYISAEARYEQRESVELAFIAALQHLPANQRAVLILRDVLGFSARETADALDTSEASAHSALQRARRTISDRLPARSQQETLRALGDRKLRRLVEAYIKAWEERDVKAIVALLAEDANFVMPPFPNWFEGRDAVAAFIASIIDTPDLRCIETRANGQPALGWYLWDENEQHFAPAAIEVYSFVGERLAQITVFASRELFERFGLPAKVAS